MSHQATQLSAMEKPLIGINKAIISVMVNQKEDFCLPVRVEALQSGIEDNYGYLQRVWWCAETAGRVAGVPTHCGIGWLLRSTRPTRGHQGTATRAVYMLSYSTI